MNEGPNAENMTQWMSMFERGLMVISMGWSYDMAASGAGSAEMMDMYNTMYGQLGQFTVQVRQILEGALAT
jgi:hypothetical protein